MRAPPRISRTAPQHVRKPKDRVRRQHQEFVRQLPCLACGRAGPSECAHVRNGTDGGAGLKPSDRFCLPLCGPGGCHNRQHRVGELSFWSDLGIDPLDYCARLWAVTGDIEQGQRTIQRARQAIALKRGV
jgi:hypothetical protein